MADLSIYEPSNLLYTQERMDRYCPGGFHPVSLGDTFKEGRYIVHHKLGWGGFSTVWLAWDSTLEMWVSIKVKTADSMMASRELDTMRALRDSVAAGHVVTLLDDFVHSGPNGDHQCLVFELLGPTVEFVINKNSEAGTDLSSETCLKISTQLLKGISLVHAAGYVHGDISGANIAFTGSKLQGLPEDELFDIIGDPYTVDLVRLDGNPIDAGLPTELVESVEWSDWNFEEEEDTRIIDCGEAFIQGSQPDKLAQPSDLRVPETIFTDHFDYRIDIWRAGMTIYTVLFGYRPFQALGRLSSLVTQMIDFQEALPSEWQSRWEEMQKEDGKEPQDNQTDNSNRQPEIEERFEDWSGDPSLKALFPVIRGLSRLRPSDRISVKDALDIISQAERSHPKDGDEGISAQDKEGDPTGNKNESSAEEKNESASGEDKDGSAPTKD